MSKFAILHIQKGAHQGGAIGRHIDRRGEVKNNINSKRSDLNAKVIFDTPTKFHIVQQKDWEKKSLATKIDERIKEGVKSKRALRSDAVRFLSVVMTYSPEVQWSSPKELNKWIISNIDFIRGIFGTENVVDFTLHFDEKTPHIHATVVPITKDGRLSAKEVMGDRKKLTRLQDFYGKLMSSVGLERGHHYEKGEKVPKHEDINDWYSKVTLPADDAVKSLANALFEEDKKKAEEIARQLQAKRLAEAEKKALQEEQKYNSAPRLKMR